MTRRIEGTIVRIILSDGFMSRRHDARKYWRISEESVAILVRALEALANVQEG
jgi:hypothetical protein